MLSNSRVSTGAADSCMPFGITPGDCRAKHPALPESERKPTHRLGVVETGVDADSPNQIRWRKPRSNPMNIAPKSPINSGPPSPLGAASEALHGPWRRFYPQRRHTVVCVDCSLGARSGHLL